jgi:phosphosulfolactate synthase
MTDAMVRDDGAAGATAAYLQRLGVAAPAPATVPFDPGYDPVTVAAHLEQSHALLPLLKLSMATWLVGDEAVMRRKIRAAHEYRVPVVCGGGPFEIAAAQGVLPDYLDLCADMGMARVEAGEGFTTLAASPEAIVELAAARGLEVQFELGRKHSGPFDAAEARALVESGRRWLGAGARQLVVEARESAADVGLFQTDGSLDVALADLFADAFGLRAVIFEAPTKPSQFALLDHFGPEVWLTNVRLEEILRVEIYRRGLHSDSFGKARLRPGPARPRRTRSRRTAAPPAPAAAPGGGRA